VNPSSHWPAARQASAPRARDGLTILLIKRIIILNTFRILGFLNYFIIRSDIKIILDPISINIVTFIESEPKLTNLLVVLFPRILFISTLY
jgi:hypothetical protein